MSTEIKDDQNQELGEAGKEHPSGERIESPRPALEKACSESLVNEAREMFQQWQEDSGLGKWLNPNFGGWKLLVERIAAFAATQAAKLSETTRLETEEEIVTLVRQVAWLNKGGTVANLADAIIEDIGYGAHRTHNVTERDAETQQVG